MNKSELLNEAKKATSIDELKQMAQVNGITLMEEEAKFYFSLEHDKEGKLLLEELDAAVGGQVMKSGIRGLPPIASITNVINVDPKEFLVRTTVRVFVTYSESNAGPSG